MVEALFEAEIWRASLVQRLNADQGVLTDAVRIETLPVPRLDLLSQLSFDLIPHAPAIFRVAAERDDTCRLAFMLDRFGWNAFSYWACFSALLERCTPALAPVLAGWLENNPDAVDSPARRAFGIYGSSIMLSFRQLRAILYAHHVAPDELLSLETYTTTDAPCDAKHLLECLHSNHGKIPIVARFPDIQSILSASPDEIAAVLH